jgi:hypothetical protein
MAGLTSFRLAANAPDPDSMLMHGLIDPVQANYMILLIAGIIMILTLWFSRKARTVTRTEVDLGRQFKGVEKFGKSFIARIVVDMGLSVGAFLRKIIPVSFQRTIQSRFHSRKPQKPGSGEIAAFDLIRASVNLMVASSLISFGTSLKLPLSTTYVTFMVAMGTSLADGAWAADSAVQRVNGVLTVIGGWFLTALLASTVAFFFALIIYFGRLPVIAVLVVLACYFVYKTHIIHRNREKQS